MSPLGGRTIVVTRPERQAAGLAQLIRNSGGRVLLFPAIGIEPVQSAALDAVLGALQTFDLAIFISRNAVDYGVAKLRDEGLFASLPATAALGSGTRQGLEAEGLTGVIAPDGPADSEALLARPELASVRGRRLLIFRGVGGREVLASALRSRGAVVEYAECYRRTRPATDAGPLLEEWARGAVDAVAISSAEGLANFAGLVGEAGAAFLRSTPVFVPHRRVEEKARALGLAKVVVAGAADEEMSAALVAYFGGAG